jgi:DNA polymerase-3 subunit delta
MNSPGGYIYLLYGEDTFGRDETVARLKARMRALPAGEHNLIELAGPEATVATLRLNADAVPFLAPRRMVVVHGLIGRLQGRGSPRRPPRGSRSKAGPSEPDEVQALLDYLPNVPQTTSLVFVEDGTPYVEPIVAAIPSGRAHVQEFPRVLDVAGWVRKRARLHGVDLDESAVRELAMLGGDDLRRLDNEVRKLGVYAAGRTVNRRDVRELVVGRDVAVWALLDGLAERRVERALRALRALYAQGESPEALLARDIGPHYRRLFAARELALARPAERAKVDPSELGLNPRTLPKWTEQAGRFEPAELERALEWLLLLDRQIKTGEANAETALELLVVQLCSRLGSQAA